VKRLGRTRLSRFCYRHSRGAWGDRLADALLAAAAETLELWNGQELDYPDLAEDIAIEARLALQLTEEIKDLDERAQLILQHADPNGILTSAPGIGPVTAVAILGRPDPLHLSRRCPRVHRPGPHPRRLRTDRPARRADQTRRRSLTRSTVPGRRRRTPDRPTIGREIPPAHGPGR
jgi:transposase